jgi:glycosyltransferase involved in cell wall biosynthesis
MDGHMLEGTVAVIPAFNEELTIGSIVLLTKPYVGKVIVVDDGSSDRTASIALEAGAEVLRMERNGGKAKAVLTGLERAGEHSPRCVVLLDGDGQMDPAEIPQVAAPILSGEADLVIGSRFVEGQSDVPRHRLIGINVLNKVTNLTSHVNLTDTQSGYRAMSGTALDNMDFRSKSYNLESDMIAHFAAQGLVIKEVPVQVRYDVPNGHKQNPFRHGLSVLSRVIGFVGYKRPLLTFGIPGGILFMTGFILGLLTFLEMQVLFDWTLFGQSIAALSLLGVGLFLIFAALVLNSLGVLMENRVAPIELDRQDV